MPTVTVTREELDAFGSVRIRVLVGDNTAFETTVPGGTSDTAPAPVEPGASVPEIVTVTRSCFPKVVAEADSRCSPETRVESRPVHPTATGDAPPTVVWPEPVAARRLLTWYVVNADRVVTVAEIVQWLERSGFRPPGRTSKVVSDRMRADVERGRIRRVGRGRYVAGTLPSTTWRRIEASALASLEQARMRRIDPGRRLA